MAKKQKRYRCPCPKGARHKRRGGKDRCVRKGKVVKHKKCHKR